VILSLDANVLIDLMRGQTLPVITRWDEVQRDGLPVKLSVVALQEVMLGMHLSRYPERQAALLEPFVASLAVEPWTEDDAASTAKLRSVLEKRGERIGAYDTLIAGQALGRGWTMVTANVREFSRVPDLKVINWRDATSEV
jgi:tRNA(fMet)-specific endonuclease VapC